MIEYVRLTGDFLDGLVGCSSYGRTFYARPVYATAFRSVASKEWVEKHSKHFFGVVAYEKDKYDRPLLLGVVPIDREPYMKEVENVHSINTVNFDIIIDDNNETVAIKHKDGNQFFIDKDSIHLGSENAKEYAVMGETLKQFLAELLNLLKTATVKTAIGPQGFMPQDIVKLENLTTDLNNILSKKVKND